MHVQALITVAICTYNRHEHVRKLLPLLLSGQTLSEDLYRIIVVDNSDGREARERFSREFSELSTLSIIESLPPGLSRARNVALDACATRYIVYLDDDATPGPEWLSAILRAFTTHDPAVVAGPIFPIWPSAQPEWLPHKYVAGLTILDHGQNDRWLSGSELAFGANMAFKVDVLREIGGFNVGLGRRGAHSLLSEEEVEVQLALRQRGHRTFYAAAAGVDHMVHTSRLTRNYFRARMAWQAVSALLRDPPLLHLDSSQREITAAADTLGLRELMSKLMTSGDAQTFSAQLDFIYHLFAILLESKDRDDPSVEGMFAGSSDVPTMERPYRSSRYADLQYQPNAPILPTTRHLIVEGRPAHSFLYALYGELADSQLLLFPQPMAHNFDGPLAYVQRSVTPALETLMFVTLEPLVYGPSRRALTQLIRETDVACFGILHRLPETAKQADAFRDVAPLLTGIIVLAEALGEELRRRFQLNNVFYLPLHPPFARYATSDAARIRARIGVPPGHVVFSILGEARRGKGIDVLLQALDHVQRDDRQNMFFLIAGRAQGFDGDVISSSFRQKGVDHHVDVRSSDHPLNYAVLTEREFGEYVCASDVGLVLYQHEQRYCMSGVAPNYVWGFKPLVAFANSVIGRTVARSDLGIVVEEETPQAIAEALSYALHMQRRGWKPTPLSDKYRSEIDPRAVLDRLATILGNRQRRNQHRVSSAGELAVPRREQASEA